MEAWLSRGSRDLAPTLVACIVEVKDSRACIGIGKGGLLRKGSLQKSPLSRDFKDFRERRVEILEIPQTVENKWESDHILEIPETKTPVVMTPKLFHFPNGANKRDIASDCEVNDGNGQNKPSSCIKKNQWIKRSSVEEYIYIYIYGGALEFWPKKKPKKSFLAQFYSKKCPEKFCENSRKVFGGLLEG